jgi:hypothetical protein
MGVIVWRDDRCGTTIKGNDAASGALMAWCYALGGGKMVTWLSGEESGKD